MSALPSDPTKMKNGRGSRQKTNSSGSNSLDSNTPPSPRRASRVKFAGPRSLSTESMPPLAASVPQSPRSKSPPLTLASGSPGVRDKNADTIKIPFSPMDTPPKKLWEHNFRSFLSRRSQKPTSSESSSPAPVFPPVPLMTPFQKQQHQQQRHPVKRGELKQPKQQQQQHNSKASSSSTSSYIKPTKGDTYNDHSVRGGKFFQSIFGGGNGRSSGHRRKTKSLNELDEPMRNGQDRNYSPSTSDYRRTQSQATVAVVGDQNGDELNQTLRRATSTGTTAGAIVPPPLYQPHHIDQGGVFHPQQEPIHQQHHYHQQQLPHQDLQYNGDQLHYQQQEASLLPRHDQHLPSQQIHDSSLIPPHNADYIPCPTQSQAYQQNGLENQLQYLHPLHQNQHLNTQSLSNPHATMNPLGVPPIRSGLHGPLMSGSSMHSMSPSSATTEIKKAFTEFHNSSRYARDSTSAYLGDEPSTRRGDARCSMYNPGLVAQKKFGAVTQPRNYSGSIRTESGHHFLSSSLPTVDENVSIHKSMRMLRPFQTVDSWQTGRRYLIGPAALAACPLLQGISSLSISSTNHTRGLNKICEKESIQEFDQVQQPSMTDSDVALTTPSQLPPFFGCIVLGKALLSYVIQEPTQHQQQRWWSSCILILRQNYLLEYDQQTGDVLQGLPRGYAHLQYSNSYAHPDFVDALELEFFVSPCAKADRRVLTIRLEEARENRDNWISCLNRASQLGIKDLYEYDDSTEVGSGRYATVYPAKRREKIGPSAQKNGFKEESLSNQVFQTSSIDECDCAIKVIDKKEFWRRVIKGRERADTLVREASVQATMTTRCSKIPAFVRILGFFETSDHVVLELELLKGMDLFQYVSSKGVLPEKEAACILRDILTVLDGMNRAGLAHRDIKPANCLMCKSNEKAQCVVKVADFGMATFVGVDGLVRGRCGTPGYVAPEIFSAGVHGGYGNKVDVFSAGVTLYVMLCGYEPFYGETDAELVAVNKTANLEFPESDWKQISSGAKDLVKCMMEPDPLRRLSAKEALNHGWILQHAGKTESAYVVGNSGVDALSHSLHKKGESCVIS